LAGDAVGVVAAKEQSSHPVLLRYGNIESYSLQLNDGSITNVTRVDFERRLSFNSAAQRDETVFTGVVTLPLPMLKQIEFVDLPGLGGRRASDLDQQIIEVAQECPLVFLLATKLKRQLMRTAAVLAANRIPIIYIRTKADQDLRGAALEEILEQRLSELDELASEGIIAPIVAVSAKTREPRIAVNQIADLRQFMDDIVLYYEVATICAKIPRDGIIGNLTKELEIQAAGLLCFAIGDSVQAECHASRINSPQGNLLKLFLEKTR
jgi:hypothetical protein